MAAVVSPDSSGCSRCSSPRGSGAWPPGRPLADTGWSRPGTGPPGTRASPRRTPQRCHRGRSAADRSGWRVPVPRRSCRCCRWLPRRAPPGSGNPGGAYTQHTPPRSTGRVGRSVPGRACGHWDRHNVRRGRHGRSPSAGSSRSCSTDGGVCTSSCSASCPSDRARPHRQSGRAGRPASRAGPRSPHRVGAEAKSRLSRSNAEASMTTSRRNGAGSAFV